MKLKTSMRNVETFTMIANTCKEHAEKVKKELKDFFYNNEASLAILTNKTPEGERYIRNKIKVAHEVGVRVVVYDFTELSLGELIKKLKSLNEDGIMVQMPFSQDPFVNKLIMANIPPSKDVDGLNWRTKHLYGVYPATARGIFECFFKDTEQLVVVLGRSKLVGEPLADLLLHSKNTVAVCHSKTSPIVRENLLWDCTTAVVATGTDIFEEYTEDYFDSFGIYQVIDVGIRVDEEGKITGDVNKRFHDSLITKFTPVPSGVGLLTTAYLYYNLKSLVESQSYKREEI